MSNESDSFIDEVTEEVRRDRLFALFRRFGWIAIAVILAIVIGTAWREYSRAQARSAAQGWGDSVLAAQDSDDPVAALAALDAGGDGDRAALGDMLAAGAAMEADDTAAAATHLEAAVTEAEDRVMRDLARFKAVLAQGDSMDPAARDAALSELSTPGAPFRLLALEQKAIALVEADRSDDALTLIREIQAEDGVSQGLNARLTEMMIALGARPGENPALPDGADPADDADEQMIEPAATAVE
ncbi:tetratricopeptide repeat protein [Paracoccus albus]|uniref:tetratricopeptide repeat protein n=1 Tax=Paracoccus albus TaxID=3017784 RepID=UPI0022F0EDD3|nr:tetratricopeptide repeat protein [Paracoccus albus]WBU59773.1 tetratricopeptide repeat protein [Paracoccus albus]